MPILIGSPAVGYTSTYMRNNDCLKANNYIQFTAQVTVKTACHSVAYLAEKETELIKVRFRLRPILDAQPYPLGLH